MDSLWKTLNSLIEPQASHKDMAQHLLKEYEQRGYLKRLNRELLELPLGVIVNFFYRLSLLHSGKSPVYRKRDSRWIVQRDITRMNLKAAYSTGQKPSFIQAAIMLPGLRTGAVQLDPFTESEAESPNKLLSHSRIDNNLVLPQLEELGISGEQQLQCLIQGAHLCGMVVGLDLSFHLSRDAEALFRRPELFRWIQLDPQNKHVPWNHLSYDEMLSRPHQRRICSEIRETVKHSSQNGVDRFHINSELRREGYFPVPVNRECKGNVPLFIVYDNEKEEAVFTSASEQEQRTPFRFYESGDHGSDSSYYEDSVEYFSRIFPLWQKKGFDFLFLEGAFSGEPAHGEAPGYFRESPDEGVLKEIIHHAHEQRKSSAVIGSGYVDHLDRSLSLGFNSIVDQEDPLRLDRHFVERSIGLQRELKVFNQDRKVPGTLYSTLSLGEHNSPSFNQKVHLEHFCCRFMNCGQAGRRKYEMMGINDGSAGYSQSLRENRSLIWREDRTFLDKYHILEDIFQRHKPSLDKGEILDYRVDDHYAWWIIYSPRELLVAVISVENDEMLAPPLLEIKLQSYLKANAFPNILEYDFQSTSGNLVLSMTDSLEIYHLGYRGYRLYSIR